MPEGEKKKKEKKEREEGGKKRGTTKRDPTGNPAVYAVEATKPFHPTKARIEKLCSVWKGAASTRGKREGEGRDRELDRRRSAILDRQVFGNM